MSTYSPFAATCNESTTFFILSSYYSQQVPHQTKMDCSNYTDHQRSEAPCIENLFSNDPQLRMFEKDVRVRYGGFEKTKMLIENAEGLDRFSQSYKEFGIVICQDGGMRCKEWVPNATAVYLKGEFNNWKKLHYNAIGYGKWELCIPPNCDGSCPIQHLTELKLVIETKDHQTIERISPWARYVKQCGSCFKWLFWNPPRNQLCRKIVQSRPRKPDRLRIYEAHIGIASDQPHISTYRHFTSQVLPRIHDLGYNCLNLMAIMEHPYYPSAGYQVTSFFAVSSRYGTPEDLRELISVAHELGLYVIMDVTHGKASKNSLDGLNQFDGTDGCYFYLGRYGYSEENDTRRFDLSKWEVLRFLLSNLRYYMDEFNFDGFRFSDVTSMIFNEHLSDRKFTGNYHEYFGMHMNMESMSYLMLANAMLHLYYSNVVTIAEEHSGFPSVCRPVREGGLGFDYRLDMTVPQSWMQLLTEKRDEEWNVTYICEALSCKRPGEKYISYTENHEESIAKKTTVARCLMKGESMSEMDPISPKLERGLSLHKMIRLMTSAFAARGGYLTFMGNEFGHPNWVEFPSPQNNDDFQYARRQFQLAENCQLRYKNLNRFEIAMNRLETSFEWLNSASAVITRIHNDDMVVSFERAGLLFIFNFHPTKSYSNYRIGIQQSGKYRIVLDTDDNFFGGQGRNHSSVDIYSQQQCCDNRSSSLVVFLPSRCAIVMSCDGGRRRDYGDDANQLHCEPRYNQIGCSRNWNSESSRGNYGYKSNDSCDDFVRYRQGGNSSRENSFGYQRDGHYIYGCHDNERRSRGYSGCSERHDHQNQEHRHGHHHYSNHSHDSQKMRDEKQGCNFKCMTGCGSTSRD